MAFLLRRAQQTKNWGWNSNIPKLSRHYCGKVSFTISHGLIIDRGTKARNREKKNSKKPKNITEPECKESENHYSTSEDEINDIKTTHEGNYVGNYKENFEENHEENPSGPGWEKKRSENTPTVLWPFSDLTLLWLRTIKKHLKHCNYDSGIKFELSGAEINTINFVFQRLRGCSHGLAVFRSVHWNFTVRKL